MRILLFGRNGQLGWELQRSLPPLGELIALDVAPASNPHHLCGDFTDLAGLATTVQRVKPDVIVNAAAYTAVDKAESEPDLARMLNALAPGVLAEQAHQLGAWLVHYSTDYVFDGRGDQPWREDDAKCPLNVYGQTKLEGEHAVANGCLRHLILRTSWLYGVRGDNFAKTLLRLAGERASLSVVNDQFGAPTSAELLADVTVHALRAVLEKPALAGTYHCVAAGETSWFAYAQFVLERARVLGWRLKAGPEQVQGVASSGYPTAARRPLNSRLCTAKLQQAFGLQLPHWQLHVERLLQEISPRSPKAP